MNLDFLHLIILTHISPLFYSLVDCEIVTPLPYHRYIVDGTEPTITNARTILITSPDPTVQKRGLGLCSSQTIFPARFTLLFSRHFFLIGWWDTD